MKITVIEKIKKNDKSYKEERETYFIALFNTFYRGMNKKASLLDSRGENGQSIGAIFHQPGRERRTPSDGVPIYQGSFM